MTQGWLTIRRGLSRSLCVLVPLLLVPLVCGVYFLTLHAPRDWALHWTQPEIALAQAYEGGNFDAVSTPVGFDVLWTTAGNGMRLSHFDASSRRVSQDQTIRGNQAEATLGRMGNADVVIWRQDTANGALLQAAILRPGNTVRYLTLASGNVALEHPRAFALNGGVGVVFSWQKNQYDVYLTGVSATGTPVRPVRLSHALSYAFLPHAVQEPSGLVRIVYFDTCCNTAGFYVRTATYTPSGRAVGPTRQIDRVDQGGPGQSGSPNQWGIDLRLDGSRTWAAWTGNAGIQVAIWRHGRELGPPLLAIGHIQPQELTLVIAGGKYELAWQQPSDLGQELATAPLGPDGLPNGPVDRVAFEGATEEFPTGVDIAGHPVLLWDSTPAKVSSTNIESSQFSAATVGAPNTWAKIGLGLSNPLGNFFLLIVGALAVGALIAMGNILLVFGLLAVYLAAFRRFTGLEKWWAYTGVVAALLWFVLVVLGAPFPPVVVLTGLSAMSAWVALGGMVVFVLILTTTVLRRFEDLYRAATMAFMSIYFLAFLQALTVIQGQIAKI